MAVCGRRMRHVATMGREDKVEGFAKACTLVILVVRPRLHLWLSALARATCDVHPLQMSAISCTLSHARIYLCFYPFKHRHKLTGGCHSAAGHQRRWLRLPSRKRQLPIYLRCLRMWHKLLFVPILCHSHHTHAAPRRSIACKGVADGLDAELPRVLWRHVGTPVLVYEACDVGRA